MTVERVLSRQFIDTWCNGQSLRRELYDIAGRKRIVSGEKFDSFEEHDSELVRHRFVSYRMTRLTCFRIGIDTYITGEKVLREKIAAE